MNNINSLHAAVNKIVNTDFFQDHEVYANLLQYLVQASLDGSIPKEVTIAHEVFNKGKDFNAADDPTVRVHMYKLRKNLDHYYQNEGKNDDIKIMIPKGHYRVKVVKKSQKENRPGKNKISPLELVLLLGLLIAVGYIRFDSHYLDQNNVYFDKISKNNPIWGSFFKNDYPTSVVIGDFLVFHEYDAQLQRSRRIQDYEINTESELNQYIEANPDKYIENWFLGEIPHNSLTNIIDIYPVFLSFKQDIHINYTTDIDIDFIKNKNIVYIGEFKNLRALSDLIAVLPIEYETLPWWHGRISYTLDDSTVMLQTSHDWGVSRYVVDLAVVCKLPGQNNENYFIVAGFGYNSQVKADKKKKKKESLKAFEQQIREINGSIPQYFAAVLQVTGFDRASTNAEIKFFHKVEKDYYQNY